MATIPSTGQIKLKDDAADALYEEYLHEFQYFYPGQPIQYKLSNVHDIIFFPDVPKSMNNLHGITPSSTITLFPTSLTWTSGSYGIKSISVRSDCTWSARLSTYIPIGNFEITTVTSNIDLPTNNYWGWAADPGQYVWGGGGNGLIYIKRNVRFSDPDILTIQYRIDDVLYEKTAYLYCVA